MNCPACQNELTKVIYEGVVIETCNACGGEWLDNNELKRIISKRQIKFDAAQRKAFAEHVKPKTLTKVDEQRVMNCPKCSGATSPVNYGGDSGIIIDRCTDCKGIWLDAGELEQIQMFVEGMEDLIPRDLSRIGDQLTAIDRFVEHDESHHIKPASENKEYTYTLGAIVGVLDDE